MFRCKIRMAAPIIIPAGTDWGRNRIVTRPRSAPNGASSKAAALMNALLNRRITQRPARRGPPT